jgi:hypothetical protein
MQCQDISDTPFKDIPAKAKLEAWREIREGEDGYLFAEGKLQEAANAHDMEQVLFWQYVFLVWAKRMTDWPEDFDHWGDMGCWHECNSAWAAAEGWLIEADDEIEAERASFAKWLERHGGVR